MNKNLIKGIAVAVVAIGLISFVCYLIFGIKRGWVKTDAGTYYYEHGEAYSGLKTMPDGTVRYFDPATNIMVTGEADIEGNKYLFDSEGVMLTGFQETNSVKRYYNPENGMMVKGAFQNENGKYYADPETGAIATGCTVIDGKQYYYDTETGIMKTGWVEANGGKYYFDETTGEGIDGIIELDGAKYGFLGGLMITNKRATADKHLYYFGEDGKVYREIDGTKPMVALTYDDGPSQYTDAILDVYEQYGARCTFFIVGDRINWNEDVVRREAELGMEQASHTYGHDRLTSLDANGIVETLKKTDDELIRVTGKPATCLRPPEGRFNDVVQANCGFPLILWSIDSQDWKSRNADSVCGRIIGKVQDGDIVLMHDLYQSTADATVRIVPALIDAGFQLVTVEEMGILKLDGGLVDGTAYYSIPNR